MTYVDGFLVAVPTANREKYRSHAADAAPLFREFGATRLFEGWQDDVPRGKLNDLYGAVEAKEDESVLFSWIEYPDRATRDAANGRIMTDPRMAAIGDGEMPFDGKRMVYSGFEVLVDEGQPGGSYVDGVVLPIQSDRRDAYLAFCDLTTGLFLDHGATRVVEGWGDDLLKGKQTDFYRATHAEDGETVVFSWIEWPSKAARDAGWEKVMQDERMTGHPDRPFDGKRMMFGGFTPLVDA